MYRYTYRYMYRCTHRGVTSARLPLHPVQHSSSVSSKAPLRLPFHWPLHQVAYEPIPEKIAAAGTTPGPGFYAERVGFPDEHPEWCRKVAPTPQPPRPNHRAPTTAPGPLHLLRWCRSASLSP